jgi:hypothetical protein
MSEPVRLPLLYEERPPAPRTRRDCLPGGVNEARPCPWTGCRHNIVEAGPTQATCSLDIADEGGITLEEVGVLMGVTRERIRQIEATALRKIQARDRNFAKSLLRALLWD